MNSSVPMSREPVNNIKNIGLINYDSLPLLRTKVICFLLLFLILSSLPASVFAQGTGTTGTGTGTTQPVAVNTPVGAQFACRTMPNNPQDVQRFMDLLNQGFLGNQIGSGQPANTNRDTLENSEIFDVIDPKTGKALKQEMPDQKFSALELQQWLNSGIKGAYSFGVILEDSLRVGRCPVAESIEDYNALSCWMDETRLKYRNSGTGIVSDFKPLGQTLKDTAKTFGRVLLPASAEKYLGLDENGFETFTEDDHSKLRKLFGLPDSAQNSFQQNLVESGDADSVTLETYKRSTDSPILNSILTEKFNSQFQTTCSGSGTDCIISTYSMFDKYFNSYFSAEQVLSTGLPTLWFRAKKLFNFASAGGENTVQSGIWPWSAPYRQVMDKIRSKLYDPTSENPLTQFLANKRSAKLYQYLREYPNFGKFNNSLFEPHEWTDGYLISKGTSFRQWFYKEFTSEGGILAEIQKQPKSVQKAFFDYLSLLRDTARTQGGIALIGKRSYETTLKQFGYGSAQEIAARIEYSKALTKSLRGWDSLVRLDMGEWVYQKDESAQFYKYFVKLKDQDVYIPLYRDPAQWNQLEGKFWKDGHFGGDWQTGGTGVEQYESAGKNLILYEPDPIKRVDNARARDILRHPPRFTEKFIATDKGELMKMDPEMTPFLKDKLGTRGDVFVGGYRKGLELTPEDFAARTTTKRAVMTAAWEPLRNTEQMYLSALERGLGNHTYTNILSKAFSERDELLTDYFSLKGGPKWTAGMYAYWWGKQGFGNEKFSAYQLSDGWLRVSWPLQDTALYDDAYVDFFANEGSDQGDMFKRVLNALPIDKILSTAADQFQPAKDLYNSVSGRGGRDEVENIALFSSTEQECDNCSLVLNARNNFQSWQGTFRSPTKMKSYILEDTTDKTLKEVGQTLITFVHHTDLAGKVKNDSIASGEIKLSEAVQKKETCADIIKEFSVGTVLTSGLIDVGPNAAEILPGLSAQQATRNSKQKNTAAIGLYMAGIDSVGYMVFGWAAITASIAQQTIVAPKLQDCVDHIEGYYNHLFAASKEEERKKEEAKQEASKKAVEGLQKFADTVTGWFKSSEASYTHKEAEGLNKEVAQFLDQSKKNEIIEAYIETIGNAQGNLVGQELLSLWFRGEVDPLGYKTEGKRIISDEKHKIDVDIDYKTGKATATQEKDGVKTVTDLLTNPDTVRLSSTNTDNTAEQFPNRLGYVPMTGQGIMFEMTINSDLMVIDPVILNCIQATVLEQTGIALNSNNLSEVFGKVINMATDSHANIQAWKENGRIVADGIVRRFVEGPNARVQVLGNRETKLLNFETKDIGFLDSVQFEHGVIIVKPETNELLVWLKRNKKAIINQDDVIGLNVKQNDVINPETGCTEPAFDLSAVPKPGSPQIAQNVNNFNTSLDKMGPFQSFETATKRFSFYSKRVNGECKNFISILDKNTGDVYEAPIKSLITTPNGIKVVDENGKEHNLEFSAPNGIPTIQYNNEVPETLLGAQGKNGSFWYDPNTGNWYPQNGNLLPLIEAFRDGILTKVGSDGKANSVASGNVLSLNLAQPSSSGFNLPSVPEQPLALLIFVLLLAISFAGTQLLLNSKKN
ncbi:MAG: hypothetical protein Q7S92_05755 [Candidatus Diapherotrites archaeon]|nr:hypothetical protein [Candidatus Diapherotrites archaeon]